jgi:uroporphyrinogen decarboxylase
MRKVLQGLKREHDGQQVPVIVFTKGGGIWLEEIAAIGPDAIGLDWTVNLAQARRRTEGRVALQGNIDPTVLFAPEAAIREQVRGVLDSYAKAGGSDGHVFNLGHGISQFTPPENVTILVDEVHSHSRRLRTAQVAPSA